MLWSDELSPSLRLSFLREGSPITIKNRVAGLQAVSIVTMEQQLPLPVVSGVGFWRELCVFKIVTDPIISYRPTYHHRRARCDLGVWR